MPLGKCAPNAIIYRGSLISGNSDRCDMYKTFTVFLALGFLALAPLAAQAASGKIGVVNVEAVLSKSDAGQAAQSKMQAFKKKQRATLEQDQKKLKSERDTLQKNASIQSEAAQKQAQKKFQTHMQAFQTKMQKSRRAMAKKSQELLQPLKATLHDVIAKYAARHGFDMVLDKRAAIYYKDGLDLTDKILEKFNAVTAK